MNWTLLPGAERVYVYNIVRNLLVHHGSVATASNSSSSLLRLGVFAGPRRPSLASWTSGGGKWKSKAYHSSAFNSVTFKSVVLQTATRELAWNSPSTTGRRLFSQQHIPATSWLKQIYSRARRKDVISVRSFNSSTRVARKVTDNKIFNPTRAAPKQSPVEEHITGKEDASDKHLFDRLPDLTHRFHRPTKEELLAAATGFWSRLRVRFKWLTIRSSRPFNSDDLSAFFSWIIVGHVIWILVGTTTFFSLLIFTVNTVFAQG